MCLVVTLEEATMRFLLSPLRTGALRLCYNADPDGPADCCLDTDSPVGFVGCAGLTRLETQVEVHYRRRLQIGQNLKILTLWSGNIKLGKNQFGVGLHGHWPQWRGRGSTRHLVDVYSTLRLTLSNRDTSLRISLFNMKPCFPCVSSQLQLC